MLVALGGFGFRTGGAGSGKLFYKFVTFLSFTRSNSLFISMSSSTVISLPDIGSIPFSWMYFSTNRRSKIAPDDGDMTGMSGTSFETVSE
jgi:hypothetical protein